MAQGEMFEAVSNIIRLVKELNEAVIIGKKEGVTALLTTERVKYTNDEPLIEVSFKFDTTIEGALPKPIFE